MTSSIQNDVQDRNSEAWKQLCEYVDELLRTEAEEFSPREALGEAFFSEIHTLPESIRKLKKVKKIWLYGSKLKRIPPEIGEMDSLEYFDPYTSYDLHWFPYELTNCKNLKESRISTRALYGNYKNRMGFPKLDNNPVRYFGEHLKCSICHREIAYDSTNQLWISLRIGTDIVPLLVNLCSNECSEKLPEPPENYLSYAHKGGSDLKQPPDEDELWEIEMNEGQESESSKHTVESQQYNLNKDKTGLLKLIRKIWEK